MIGRMLAKKLMIGNPMVIGIVIIDLCTCISVMILILVVIEHIKETQTCILMWCIVCSKENIITYSP